MKKKKNKGTLLIAVALTSIVLLLFLMTAINLQTKNSVTMTLASEREQALLAAQAGLEAAAAYIAGEYRADSSAMSGQDKPELSASFNSLEPVVLDEDKASGIKSIYKFSCKDGLIISEGQLLKKGTDNEYKVIVTKKLQANYVIEYMGVSAEAVKFFRDGIPVAAINSIYSYASHYPMESWIGIENTETKCFVPYNGKAEVIENPAGIPEYMYFNKDGKFVPEKSFANDYKNLLGMAKSLKIGRDVSDGAYYDMRMIDGLSEEDFRDVLKDEVDLEDKDLHVFGDVDGRFRFTKKFVPNSKDKVYWLAEDQTDGQVVISGKNFWFYPFGGTVVINGDLELKKSAGITEGSKGDYPVLLLGGNLVVNGTIKGTGLVMALNNIYISAESNEQSNYCDIQNFSAEGSLIVHAANKLYISNLSSYKAWADADESQKLSYIIGSSDVNRLERINYFNDLDKLLYQVDKSNLPGEAFSSASYFPDSGIIPGGFTRIHIDSSSDQPSNGSSSSTNSGSAYPVVQVPDAVM